MLGSSRHSRVPCPQVFPVTSSGAPVSEYPFVRTGLLGFVGPGGLVFVVGKMDGLMVVSGRRHNADDIVATALAVEPMKFVYRGRWVCSVVGMVLHRLHFLCFPLVPAEPWSQNSTKWLLPLQKPGICSQCPALVF